MTTRSIEVTTSQYSSAQVAAKRDAGFRLYGFSLPGGGSQKPRRGSRGVDWEEFPLAWGR